MQRSTRPLAALAATLLLALPALPAGAATKKAPPKKKETRVTKPRDYAKTLATFKTSQGDVTIRFFFDKAPGHVKAFVDLAASGFYDGTLFHRVIPEFMIQGGDPLTKDPEVPVVRYGTGSRTDARGVPVNLRQEFNDVRHTRGIVSMARASDPDSASSQFFIVVKDSPFLDRQYTVFGEVVEGMHVVDRVVMTSDSDLADRSGGRPRSYQKILKVELSVEETAR